MKILGIDTSTKFLSVGISDKDRVYEYNLDLGRAHSALLQPTLKRILDALGWRIQDVDYFACGLGPGSFTGIRVGVAAIKGLAFSLQKPVVGISTLDILAKNVIAAQGPVMPAVDAKRGLIYCSIYKFKNRAIKRTAPYMLLAREEFIRKTHPNAIIIGDAVGLYRQDISAAVRGAVFPDKDCWYPKGHNIISLARERISAGKLNDAFDLGPIYLYPKECQVRNP
jgi:tRNA threonylcarbamoyladenosine biosynthesis protein TsaB